MATIVRPCFPCKPHTYQDKTYGVGRRVHNETPKGWRCTVCGKVVLR